MNNFPPEIRAYSPICLCGQGAYGAVWLVTDATGVWLALKIVYKNSLGGDWQREFSGLEYYRNKVSEHANLIRIHHIEDCGTFFYYTMDCADNLSQNANPYCPATLANKIKQSGALPPDDVREIFDQLLDGLEHLHESGVIHRDIKPDNIVFVNGVPKIGDIGLVSSVSHTLSLAGTQDFVPPEYLTGQEKEIRQSIDLYALGKTLYCAFSGQDPKQFPLLPPAILKAPSNRIFNELAKGACTTSLASRIKTIPEFRSILHGNIGWGYEIRRVFSWLFKRLALPFILLWLVIRFLLTHKWILVILFLLIVVWLGMVLKTYWRLEKELYPYDYGFHSSALKRAFTEWNVEFGNYDLYDMEKKTKYSIKAHGERHLVTKKEYLRRKHTYIPQNIGFGFEVDEGPASLKGKSQVTVEEPPLTQNTPLRENYLYELFFQGIYSPKLEVPAGTEWRDNRMLLPAVKKGTIRFTPELPLTSEVNLDFNPSKFNGTLEFVLTAAEYLPLPNKPLPSIQLNRQLRFKMVSDGKNLTFEEAVYRHQDSDEDDLMGFGRPKIKTIPIQDKFYRLTIISADHVRRVYLNGNLIWGTHLAFFGGRLELKYSCKTPHGVSVGDFSVYDAKIVQPDEKRQSRLKLPTPQPLIPPTPQVKEAPIEKNVKAAEQKQIKKILPPPIVPSEPVPATKPSVSQSESVPIKTIAVPSPKPIPVTKAKVKKASVKPPPPKFVPVRKNAKDLSRRDYKDVQEDIVEYISRRKNLKDIIPDYQNIPAENVMIDTYYAHEKGGKVYEFIIPSKKIKGAIRLQYMGAISYRELEEFYFNGKKIDPYH